MCIDPAHAGGGSLGPRNLKNRGFARVSLLAMLTVVVLSATLAEAAAQAWPQRPIMLIVPYPPGGTVDFQARIMGERLSAKLGQPVVIQNKTGAAGIIATEFVVHSKPDGYTLLFASSAQTTSVPMTEKVDYKLDDLIPISASGNGPMILAVNAQMSVHSLKEFIDHVMANPDKYTYASAGTGSVAHLVGALFVARAGLQALHVPYRGGGPAVAALLGAQVDFYFGNSADLMPHAQNDLIRILGVSTPKRMPQLPDVPAVNELIPGFEMAAWQGFLAPAHTPQPIINRLENEISSIAKEPGVIKKLTTAGVEATSTNQAQFMEIIQKEQGIYAEAVQAAGLKRN
jgi:tripartite-type tricarboxylate transporter receptor subunit TctC